MIRAVIKRTGNNPFENNIEPTFDSFKMFLGDLFEEIYINKEFEDKNINVLSNPKNFESGLEPNLFVLNYDSKEIVTKILFGNTVFVKKLNNEYISLTDDDVTFILEYIEKANMSENEKFMASLLEYSPKEVGYKFLKNREK